MRYRRVCIAGASALCAAGDAAQAWAACREGRSALVEDADLGWIGRVDLDSTGRDRLLDLADRAGAPLLAHRAYGLCGQSGPPQEMPIFKRAPLGARASWPARASG